MAKPEYADSGPSLGARFAEWLNDLLNSGDAPLPIAWTVLAAVAVLVVVVLAVWVGPVRARTRASVPLSGPVLAERAGMTADEAAAREAGDLLPEQRGTSRWPGDRGGPGGAHRGVVRSS